MRLTLPLQHVKRFWWGKGWGPKPRKNTDKFYLTRQWARNDAKPLDVVEQVLPETAVVIDPNTYLREDLNKGMKSAPIGEFLLPWPHSKRPVKGSVDDPKYQSQVAYVYQKTRRLVEPVNLPLNFTNSVLEEGLPSHIQSLRENVQIDDDFVTLFERRIKWCLQNDSAMRKLPIAREFPYIDQRPPRMWGTTTNKKEYNLLLTLYDLCNSWMAKKYGFNSEIFQQRISEPNNVLHLNRDNDSVVLDLECEFITLLSPTKNGVQLKSVEFDSNYKTNTADKVLTPIYPLSWKIGFNDENFYNTNYEFEIPQNSQVQTIFLSNNHVRMNEDVDYQGRAIMFCYGFAVQQAKMKYQTDNIDQIVLDKPICIQCVYVNPVAGNPAYPSLDFKIGFVLYQLNTLKFDDATIRNQVWFSEPKSVGEEAREAFADLVTVQSLGLHH